MGLRGGGKRGRVGAGGSAGGSKDNRIKMLKEPIATSMIRINAIPGVSPVVTEMMIRFNQLSQGMVSNPTHIFSEILKIPSGLDLLKMVEATTSSNNLKARFNAIMNLVFKTYIDRMDELRSQLKLVESISVDIVELMLVSQYGDTTGNITWSDLSKEIACTMAVVAQQSATNMQSAGIGL